MGRGTAGKTDILAENRTATMANRAATAKKTEPRPSRKPSRDREGADSGGAITQRRPSAGPISLKDSVLAT